MPPSRKYDSAGNIPRDICNEVKRPEYLVKVLSRYYGDYGMHVAYLLNDLERHEDRWKGAILDEILLGSRI